MLGKVNAKGSKVGRDCFHSSLLLLLFPHFLVLLSPTFSSFTCIVIPFSFEDWHNRHPNSIVFSHLIKNGLLGCKTVVSNSSF